MSLRSALRNAFHAWSPEIVRRPYLRSRLRRRASRLATVTAGMTDPAQLTDATFSFMEFRPIQIRSEILALLERVRSLRPATILEIGSANGGTTILFSRIIEPGTKMISLDLSFDEGRREAVKILVGRGVDLHCLRADSHSAGTVREVQALLSSRPVDFLFIDGDHSYEGVRSDYRMYSPLVASGGLIALHDVVPDFRTRFGVQTVVDVGGVPRFWKELKSSLPGDAVEEIIEDPDQDGYGIGLVRVS
jgi:cephalosporin hydroxylase